MLINRRNVDRNLSLKGGQSMDGFGNQQVNWEVIRTGSEKKVLDQ